MRRLLVVISALVLIACAVKYAILPILLAFAVFSIATAYQEIRWRTYSRRGSDTKLSTRFPEPMHKTAGERRFFTIIIPAVNEAEVLPHTLQTLSEQLYDNFEVIVTLRSDDPETYRAIQPVVTQHPDLFKVVVTTFPEGQRNKSYQMNAVLDQIRGDYTGVIDAEDIVALDLLRYVDGLIDKTGAHVVQGGVQLTNLDLSHPDDSWARKIRSYVTGGWFAVHNVLEYYMWFSSRMFYQISHGFVPLGGNTVFIETNTVHRYGGWRPKRLTEDFDFGARMSTDKSIIFAAAWTPELATQEHTPPRIFKKGGWLLQRVRWDQGFIEVLGDGMWAKLPTLRQKAMALYISSMPLIQAFNGVMLPICLIGALSLKAPVLLVLMMFIPFVFIVLSLALQIMALREFSVEFGIRASPRHYISLVLGFFPYQILLAIAALYSIYRHKAKNVEWAHTSRSVIHHTKIHTPVSLPQQERVLV